MHHIRAISRRPAKAQFEPLLQLVGLASALLGLLQQAAALFGFNIPQKTQ